MQIFSCCLRRYLGMSCLGCPPEAAVCILVPQSLCNAAWGLIPLFDVPQELAAYYGATQYSILLSVPDKQAWLARQNHSSHGRQSAPAGSSGKVKYLVDVTELQEGLEFFHSHREALLRAAYSLLPITLR